MPPIRLLPLVVAALAGLLIAACAGNDQDAASPTSPAAQRSPVQPAGPTSADLPMNVLVTLPVFADFVREMGGDNVEVSSIVPLGADPHTYQPTADDIERIGNADIIFINNRDPALEGAILDVIESNKGETTKVIPFMPNIRSPRGRELGNTEITAAEAEDNPHLWLDPFSARIYVGVVSDTLVLQDGVNAELYIDNLNAYDDALFEMRNEIVETFGELPSAARKLVTAHDSVPHLASRYNFSVAGFVANAEGETRGDDEISALAEAISSEGVRAVFSEPHLEAANAVLEQLAADAGIPVCTLYTDNLSDEAPTYIEMMRFNVNEIRRCLGGEGG